MKNNTSWVVKLQKGIPFKKKPSEWIERCKFCGYSFLTKDGICPSCGGKKNED